MIIDCHTHIWTSIDQLGRDARAYIKRQSGHDELAASPSDHAQAAECVDKTLVLGYRSAYLGADVPNDLIAEYVSRHNQGTIGIAGIDPTERGAVEMARQCLDRSEFRGLTISPASQNFHPADSRAMKIYELAASRGVPVFVHHGTHFVAQGRMEYARPFLLDEVAREFPTLTLVVASMGHPWVEEAIALVGKHPRVFTDIAGLVRRPWQAYNALVMAHQFNVMEKVLFGSDFPYYTASQAVQSLYRLHEVTQGTNLPSVPRELLRSVVERDALGALGIARPGEQPQRSSEDDDEA